MKATIYFSDNSVLHLNQADRLVPVVPSEDGAAVVMGEPVQLCPDVHGDLVPSVLYVLNSCRFFYVYSDLETVYCTGTIVKVVGA